jgi:hypothetical protein
MSLLRRVKQRRLYLTSGAGDSDGARFYSQTGEDRFRPHFVAVEWLESPSVKQAILSSVHCFLEQQKYELMCKTAATPIFCESETVVPSRCG